MSQDEHKARAPRSVRCFVITVSDTRTEDNDTGGRAIADLLTAAGHEVAGRTIVKDDPELVRGTHRTSARPSRRPGDHPHRRHRDHVPRQHLRSGDRLLQKRIDGFGELFRRLSYDAIGPAAMMSRACAGLVAGHIVISLPGSEGAVRLAMEKLLIPELGHLVEQAAH